MKKFKVLLVVLVAVLLVSGCGKKNEEKKEPATILAEQTVEGVKISGLNINYVDGLSNIVANVQNKNEIDKEIRVIEIKFYDEKDVLIAESFGFIGKTLKPNENVSITTSITSDITNAKKVEYKIQK